MFKRTNFFIIILIIVFFTLSAASAGESNATSANEIGNYTNDFSSYDNQVLENGFRQISNESFEKTNPVISLENDKVKSKDTLYIHLKNSSGNPLKSKNLTLTLNSKKYSISTNSKGIASMNINLPAKTYKLEVTFAGDDKYNPVSKNFKLKVSKSDTRISPHANLILSGKNLYVDLTSSGNPLSSKRISIKINGRTYARTTDKNGRATLKVSLAPSAYNVILKYSGDKYYKSSQKKFKFNVMRYASISIGNSKLLTEGYLRIYLKDYSPLRFAHKTVTVKIANKKFTGKTDCEGVLILKPDAGVKTYNVVVKCGKYWTSKKVRGVKGSVKDPLNETVCLKNGVPDVDLMPKNYRMGDGSATYTLTKAQYREVLQRDSYCLFLKNKLSKYTFFKTKSNPNASHIIKREKWNVIERAINAKLVTSNRNGYWPDSITVSLKGKAYTYSEVRDVQNTGYTCGPTSASVCSQVLRNYLCEKYLADRAGSKPVIGTPCDGMIKALGKNFNCTYFYRDSFDNALNELKKGGCALIFHTKYHYVTILDISRDGKKVLVSNSYGNYYNIPTKWLSISYMKTRFITNRDDSLIVRLNYSLSNSTKHEVNCYYASMGANWIRQNTHQTIGLI